MVKIVFVNNTGEKKVVQIFRAAGVRLASNCIYGVFNGNEVPIALGGGDIWRVDDRIFNSVEIISMKENNPPTRKVA